MANHKLFEELGRYIDNVVSEVESYKKSNQTDFRKKIVLAASVLLNAAFKVDLEPVVGRLKTDFGIDLRDKARKLGAIVLWDSDVNAVKRSIKGFLNSSRSRDLDRILVYIVEKKGDFSQNTFPEKKTQGNNPVFFDVHKDILDSRTLYELLRHRRDESLIRIINYLKDEFPQKLIGQGFSAEELNTFRRDYAEKYVDALSKINFLGLSLIDVPSEIDLQQIYIKPHYSYHSGASDRFQFRTNKENFSRTNRKPLYELFTENRHIVLVGNPGAGKSLISRFIIGALTKGEREFEDPEVYECIPFRVELRNYYKFRKEQPKEAFLSFIRVLLVDHNIYIDEDQLFIIFSKLRTLVFFDGLDEIFDVDDRQRIVHDIENFVGKFCGVRCVVTSRYESYNEVKPQKFEFKLFELLNFNAKQMEEFVRKWYAIEMSEQHVIDREASEFIEKIEVVEDELKFSPLLLSLIMLVYRSNGKEIPTTKFEIFKACTETLVSYRDKNSKDISLEKQLNNELDNPAITPEVIFSNLGYWQFERLTLDEFVDARSVNDFIMYLFLQLSGNTASEDLIKTFLTYAKRRSIYVDNQFTHKTFLEYFAANCIHSRYRAKGSEKRYIKDILKRHADDPSWRVLLELLFSNLEYESDLNLEVIIDDMVEEKNLKAVVFFLDVLPRLKPVDGGLVFRLTSQCIRFAIEGNILAFDQLLRTKSNPVMHSVLHKALQRHYTTKGTITEEAITFLYEFSIVTADVNLLQLIPEGFNPTQYQLVLKNHQKFESDQEYLKWVGSLNKAIDREQILTCIFSSRFGKNLFFHNKQLNLITSFLFKKTVDEWENSFHAMLQAGISIELIRRSIDQALILQVRDITSIENKLSHVSDPEFQQVLVAVLGILKQYP